MAVSDVGIVIRRNALLGSATKHADDAQANRGNGKSGAPAIIKNVQTDVPIRVDMRMTRGRGQKHDLGSLHGVIRGKNEAEGILFILVNTAGGAGDDDEPLVDAVRLGDRHARHGRVLDGPLGELAGEAALRDAGELSPARGGRAANGVVEGRARGLALLATRGRRELVGAVVHWEGGRRRGGMGKEVVEADVRGGRGVKEGVKEGVRVSGCWQ